jgi:hypothetical protein
MMSCKRRATRLEGTDAVPIDGSLKAFFAGRLFNHVDLAAKDGGEPFEFVHSAEVVEAASGKILGQSHRQVDIGILPRVTARNGPKQGRTDYPDRFKFRLSRSIP